MYILGVLTSLSSMAFITMIKYILNFLISGEAIMEDDIHSDRGPFELGNKLDFLSTSTTPSFRSSGPTIKQTAGKDFQVSKVCKKL